MATITLTAREQASLTLYAVFFRKDGKVFDWNDNSWQLIDAAVQPAIALTATVNFGDSKSDYAGDVDLEVIAPDMTPVDGLFRYFKQAGGSADPTSDLDAGATDPLRLIYGEPTGETLQDCVVDVTFNLTTTDGVSAHLTVELKRPDGSTLPLSDIDPTATCAIVVTRDASVTGGERIPEFDLDTTDCGSVNAAHRWEIEYGNPGLAANKGYTAVATVVSGGVTYEGADKFYS